MLKETPVCEFGWKPPEFRLQNARGRAWSLDDVRGPNGALIVFMCNHCPYVKAIVDRLSRDARALKGAGIGVAAIMPNDYRAYPADAPERMAEFAAEHGLDFPYLVDEDQSVARAWGAACTPDFFGFNADLELQYRGRIDSSPMEEDPEARRELLEAMTEVARTGKGPEEQVPSMGCSIKWRP